MKRQIFPTASKYRRRTRREFGGETVEYIIVILAVVVIGGGLMGFGNQVSGQIGKTGNSISSWFGKANGAGDNASGGNGAGGGNNAGGENKGDESSGSQLQAPTVSVTGMDVVGERVTAKVSNLPAGATQVHAALPPMTHQLRFQVWVKGITPLSSSTTSFPISRRAISPTDGLNAPASEAAPSLLPRNSAPAHLYLSQVYRDRASIAR